MRAAAFALALFLALPSAALAQSAAPKPAWADAVRCAAIAERMPRMGEVAVAQVRTLAAENATARGLLPKLEKSLADAAGAMSRSASQVRQLALQQTGDRVVFEQAMAEARKPYAGLDSQDVFSPEMRAAFDRMNADLPACQAAFPSQAPGNAG